MLALIIIALILFSLRRPLWGGWGFWPFGGWWVGWHHPPIGGSMHGPGPMGHDPRGMGRPGGMGGPIGGNPHR